MSFYAIKRANFLLAHKEFSFINQQRDYKNALSTSVFMMKIYEIHHYVNKVRLYLRCL